MKKLFFFVPIISLAFFACRKLPDTGALSVSFAVSTAKNADADFGSYKTYSMSDTIKLRTTNPNDTVWDDIDAQRLINQVKQNLEARGYTFVGHSTVPDIGIGFTAVKDLNVGVVYPGWWWGYWGCYWYYCGYPPYYGYGQIYSVPTGTLILDMIDLKNANENQRLDVIWSSVMTGGLGYTNDDIDLGIEAVDQSFTQSPYIETH